jgi:hypothetical protein
MDRYFVGGVLGIHIHRNHQVDAVTWPFPPFPNPKDTGTKQPRFNPDNHEDAPL